MQFNSAILDDLAKLASSAAGRAMDVRRELQAAAAAQVAKFMENNNFVTKDEFDAVRAMALKARSENEELKKRLGEVEAKLEQLARK